MNETRCRTVFVSPGWVGAAFALSGLASCLTMAVVLWIDVGSLAMIAPPLVFFLGGAWAARSLSIERLARLGVGLAITIGTLGSFVPFIGTQAMKGNETFVELLPGFAMWFVAAYGMGSAIGLLPLLAYGAKVHTIGDLGFCVGAVLSALVVVLAMANKNNSHSSYFGVLLIFLILSLPEIVGGFSLAWGLNSTAKRERKLSPESPVAQTIKQDP